MVKKHIWWISRTFFYTYTLYNVFTVTKAIKFKRIRLKVQLLNKMFKIKKFKTIIKPMVHLSNLFFTIINQQIKYKRKKKRFTIYTRRNYLISNLRTLIWQRKINEYTKRGLFLKKLIFLKKKR